MAEGYQPVPSLWALILDYVDQSEAEEIKELLGQSLVDETIDLHDEVNSLLTIWNDYRKETEDLEKEANTVRGVFPEPPAVRDRLKQEVRFFVMNLRQKAKEERRPEMNAQGMLAAYNNKVIDYVLEATTDDGGHTCGSKERTLTPTSDTSSRGSNLSDQIDLVQHQLNMTDIHVVTDHLRSALEEECSQLKRDIRFLQESLEDECKYRDDVKSTQPPSLKELRECSRLLEQEYVRGASVNVPLRRIAACQSPNRTNQSKDAARPSSAQKFRKMVLETRNSEFS